MPLPPAPPSTGRAAAEASWPAAAAAARGGENRRGASAAAPSGTPYRHGKFGKRPLTLMISRRRRSLACRLILSPRNSRRARPRDANALKLPEGRGRIPCAATAIKAKVASDHAEAQQSAAPSSIRGGARAPSRRPDRRTMGVTPTAAAERQALERTAGAGAREAEPRRPRRRRGGAEAAWEAARRRRGRAVAGVTAGRKSAAVAAREGQRATKSSDAGAGNNSNNDNKTARGGRDAMGGDEGHNDLAKAAAPAAGLQGFFYLYFLFGVNQIFYLLTLFSLEIPVPMFRKMPPGYTGENCIA